MANQLSPGDDVDLIDDDNIEEQDDNLVVGDGVDRLWEECSDLGENGQGHGSEVEGLLWWEDNGALVK